ncbi:anti-sigma-L factor RslA [Myceligenerans cantabricum]
MTVPTETNGGDHYAEWDAAYVLGALSPSERHAYERHLAACDACRAAVAELAGMPGLLGAVSPAQAQRMIADEPDAAKLSDDGPGGPAGVDGPGPASVVPLARLAHAARRSRRRRRTLGAVAASALVFGAAVGGSALGDLGPAGFSDDAGTTASSSTVASARTVVLHPVGETDMRAQVVVTPTAWGTKLEWRCHYPPAPGQDDPPGGTYVPREPIRYELVLVGRDGGRTVAATWAWAGGTTTGLGASSAVSLTDLDRIEITLDGQQDALAAATL